MSTYKTRSYAAINKDDWVRKRSSSGGVFFEIARHVIQAGGIVVGAAFDDGGQVCHRLCDSLDALPELMRSKYVQSRMGDTYKKVQAELSQERSVLFAGTPCQVYGCLSYLEASRVSCDKLITVDFVCHGVPSRMIWRAYLKEISHGRTPTYINFRDKTNGWIDFSLKIDFSDGSQYIKSKNKDPYVQGFLKNLFLRESCYNCSFRGVDRISDFTIADFWKVKGFLPEMFDDRGTSVVMVHNDKAFRILENLRDNMVLRKIDNAVIVQTNRPVVHSVKRNPKRDAFFTTLSMDKNIGIQISKEIKISFVKRLFGKVNRMIRPKRNV